ncbi:MAG: hypothetical protein H0V82_02670 [Candidatus Protochlamydia sp.]|nr:hypothetical protein [Candidatus Protochlamydia sp.]
MNLVQLAPTQVINNELNYSLIDEIKALIPYSFAVPTVADGSWEYWLKPVGFEPISPGELSIGQLPGQLEARTTCFFCPETALKVALFKKGNELMIVFGALDSFTNEVPEKDHNSKWWSVIKAGAYNLLWGRPLAFERAHQLVQLLQNATQFKDNQMVLVGQSFGGGLAAYTALKIANCRGICFNSLPLGSWVNQEIEDCKNLGYAKITQVTVKLDWLPDNYLMRNREIFESYVSMPWLPGRTLSIPTAYPGNIFETHAYIVGSLLKFTGHEITSSPREVMGNF